MTTPRASIPSLRSILGAIACRRTTTTSAVRGLYSLQGGLTETDIDVRDVVNALVDAVESLRSGVRTVSTVVGVGTDPSDLVYLADEDALVFADVETNTAVISLPKTTTPGRRITVVASASAGSPNEALVLCWDSGTETWAYTIAGGTDGSHNWHLNKSYASATFEYVSGTTWLVTAYV